MTAAKKLVDYQEEGWTVPELKEELQERELPVTGNKPDLIKRLEADDRAKARKASKPAATPAPAPAPAESEPSGIFLLMDVLGRIADALEAGNVTITIGSGPNYGADTPAQAPQPTEAPAADSVSREQVRDAARQLLAVQPDGRARALNVLGQYGGSVSAVPEEQLEACLSGLNQELAAAS